MKLEFKKNILKKLTINKLIIIVIILTLLFNIPTLIEHQDATLESKIIHIITSLSIVLSFFLLPILVYYANKRAKKKVIKESLSIIDFKNSKEYYRDILKNNSPIELSYVDNFEIDYLKDTIATLLNLKLKNKITIENNYINIINKDTKDLHKSEIYILDNIKDGKVTNLDSYEILGYAKEEALANGMIVKNKVKRQNYNKRIPIEKLMIFWFLFMSLLTILLFFFNQNIVDFLNNVFIPNINIFLPIIIGIVIIIRIIKYSKFYNSVKDEAYYQYKSRSYTRTEEGEILNKKIEGLKNYLKDFSALTEKEQQELILWEEYLIYSVLFNTNHKIIKELSSLIANIKEDII